MYSLLNTNLQHLLDILYQDESKLSVSSFYLSSEEDVFDKQDLDEFPFIIPSCFTHISSNTCIQSCKVEKTDQYDFVPFEILVTAGAASIMFYYHENTDNLTDSIVLSELCEEEGDERNISNSYEKSIRNLIPPEKFPELKRKATLAGQSILKPYRVHPFLCVFITQPHSYVMCRPCTQKFESSCFDLQLCGSSASYFVESKIYCIIILFGHFELDHFLSIKHIILIISRFL